jgi:hypothetical protein
MARIIEVDHHLIRVEVRSVLHEIPERVAKTGPKKVGSAIDGTNIVVASHGPVLDAAGTHLSAHWVVVTEPTERFVGWTIAVNGRITDVDHPILPPRAPDRSSTDKYVTG